MGLWGVFGAWRLRSVSCIVTSCSAWNTEVVDMKIASSACAGWHLDEGGKKGRVYHIFIELGPHVYEENGSGLA